MAEWICNGLLFRTHVGSNPTRGAKDKIMDKEKLFNDVLNYLAGSCKGIDEAFSDVCRFSEPPIEMVNQETLDEFAVYLENNEMYCCENCGWWNYPGEGDCECLEDCWDCDTEDNDED